MGKRLFRTVRNMRYKKGSVPPGTLVWLDKPEKTIDRLLELRVISYVRCPPLQEFPGWEKRGPLLESEGISDVEDFLGRDPQDLAELLEEQIETVESWQRQLTAWLSGAPAAA